MRLPNKVAIITGASSGMGRVTAYLFAKEGAKVAVADVNDTGGEETVSNIKANGGEAIFVHTDVSSATDVQNLVKETVKKFGRIDILFNNAGKGGKRAPVEKLEESIWDDKLATNLKGVFLE